MPFISGQWERVIRLPSFWRWTTVVRDLAWWACLSSGWSLWHCYGWALFVLCKKLPWWVLSLSGVVCLGGVLLGEHVLSVDGPSDFATGMTLSDLHKELLWWALSLSWEICLRPLSKLAFCNSWFFLESTSSFNVYPLTLLWPTINSLVRCSSFRGVWCFFSIHYCNAWCEYSVGSAQLQIKILEILHLTYSYQIDQ